MASVGSARPLHCLAVVLCAAAAASAQPSGRITGSVRDSTNAPLANVTIALLGPAERTAQSGADGTFAFDALPDGEYELRAALAGFAPAGAEAPAGRRGDRQRRAQAVGAGLRQGRRHGREVGRARRAGDPDGRERAARRRARSACRRAASRTWPASRRPSRSRRTPASASSRSAASGPTSCSPGPIRARPCTSTACISRARRWCSPTSWTWSASRSLRGPQGTLYGRNAVGGALNVVTRPTPDGLEAAARLSVGDYQTLRAEARIGGPLVAGRVTGSAAVLRSVRQGYVRDLDHADHPLGGEDATAARGKLRVGFGARGDLVVSGDVTHQDPTPLTYAKVLAVKPGFEVDNPADLHEVRTSTLAREPEPAMGRERPSHAAPLVRDDAHQPDRVPEAGLRRPGGYRRHGAGAHRHPHPRDPAPVVRGGHALGTRSAADVGRRAVPARRQRPSTHVCPPGGAARRAEPRPQGRGDYGSPVRTSLDQPDAKRVGDRRAALHPGAQDDRQRGAALPVRRARSTRPRLGVCVRRRDLALGVDAEARVGGAARGARRWPTPPRRAASRAAASTSRRRSRDAGTPPSGRGATRRA